MTRPAGGRSSRVDVSGGQPTRGSLRFRAAFLGGLACITTLATAPAATASTSSFLNELEINDVWLPQKTSDDVVDAGYKTCSELRGGTSVLDEMTAVEQRYSFTQGSLFVSAATTHLCPDFATG